MTTDSGAGQCGPGGQWDYISSGLELSAFEKFEGLSAATWCCDNLICSSIEIIDSITDRISDPPRLYALDHDNKVNKKIQLESNIYSLIQCGNRDAFATISFDELAIYSPNLDKLSSTFHRRLHRVGCWDTTGDTLITIRGSYLDSWRFRYGQYHLMTDKQIFINDSSQLTYNGGLQIICNKKRDVVLLLPDCLIVTNLDTETVHVRRNMHKSPMMHIASDDGGFENFRPSSTGGFEQSRPAIWLTGAVDGTIKIWCATSWNMLRTFVSHDAPVCGILCIDYADHLIVSTSTNGKIFYWNNKNAEILNRAVCQSESSDIKQSSNRHHPRGVSYNFKLKKLALWGPSGITQWKRNVLCHRCFTFEEKSLSENQNHIGDEGTHTQSHVEQIVLGKPILSDKESDGRIAVLLGSTTVSIVSIINNEVIGTQQFEHPVTAFEYQRVAEILLVCSNGTLYSYGCADFEIDGRKMPLLSESEETIGYCTGVAVYSPEQDDDVINQEWKHFVTEKNAASRSSFSNPIIVILGTKTGKICSIDITTGTCIFSIEQFSPVLNLKSSSTRPCLFSFAANGNICIWRIFAHSTECLALEERITHEYAATSCALLKDAAYVTYNIFERQQFVVRQLAPNIDHARGQDHTNRITAIDSCERLGFLISGGSDGTIHLWDRKNQLTRIIDLGLAISALTIASMRGDIVLAFEGSSQLYFIRYNDYLPKEYIDKHILESIGKTEEKGIEVIIDDEKESARKIESHPVGLSKSKTKIAERDKDIDKIKKSNVEEKLSSKKRRTTQEMEDLEDEAFDIFMELMHPKRQIKIPDDSDYYPRVKLKQKIQRFKRHNSMLDKYGALPNSALRAQLLPKEEFEKMEDGKWQRPKFDFSGLHEIEPSIGDEDEIIDTTLVTETNMDGETMLEKMAKGETLDKKGRKGEKGKSEEVEERKGKRGRKGKGEGSLLSRMQAAIDNETKKDEDAVKKAEERKRLVEQEMADEKKAADETIDKMAEMKNSKKTKAAEAEEGMRKKISTMYIKREEIERKKRETVESPKTVELTQRSKPETPPPRTPQKPEWSGLENYKLSIWFGDLQEIVKNRGIRITTEGEFIDILIEMSSILEKAELKCAILNELGTLNQEDKLEDLHILQTNRSCHSQLKNVELDRQSKLVFKLLTWLRINDVTSNEFAIEMMIWIKSNFENDLISCLKMLMDCSVTDENSDIIREVRQWEGDPRRAARKFIDTWLTRLKRSATDSFGWQGALRLFMEIEQEKRQTVKSSVSFNAVLARSKREVVAETALVRVGDLHTARRMEHLANERRQRRFSAAVLPPVELRIANPAEPKFNRLHLPQKKILIAPFGEYWCGDRAIRCGSEASIFNPSLSRHMLIDAIQYKQRLARIRDRLQNPPLLALKFQRFFAIHNSHIQ